MRSEANRTRDPFRFSLRGRTATNPYVIVPTMADDKINQAWAAKLRRPAPVDAPKNRTGTLRGVEDVLARYFAPGRQAA